MSHPETSGDQKIKQTNFRFAATKMPFGMYNKSRRGQGAFCTTIKEQKNYSVLDKLLELHS